jgi:hypothetical protein
VTGTITALNPWQRTGTITGEDGKTYTFKRTGLRDVWFHELAVGTNVTFEPIRDFVASQISRRDGRRS